MAQFVLVNVVVAVLMKHLEESHKQMEEDEDNEIDLEIAKEIEAEKKALIEAIERRKREINFRERNRPLMKMASLPSNFTFTCLTSTPLEEFAIGEVDHNLSQWTNQSKQIEGNKRQYERIELQNMGNKCNHNSGQRGKTDGRKGLGKSGTDGEPYLAMKPSNTCHSIFISQAEPAPSPAGSNGHNHQSDKSANCKSNQTVGILRKSNSLRVKSNKPTLIDSIKRSSLYRKTPADAKNLNVNKNEDEQAFLANLDEVDDFALEDANLHISKSTEAISSLERQSSWKQLNRSGHGSVKSHPNSKSVCSCKNAKIAQRITFKDDEQVKSSFTVSPVTINIENYHGSSNLVVDRPQEMINQTGKQPIKCTSPSRVTSNGLRHRKLSDFLDEESAPLGPGLLSAYPEFTNDTSYDDDLNDEDAEVNEQLSLASAESWPSADVVDPSTNVILNMEKTEQSERTCQ